MVVFWINAFNKLFQTIVIYYKLLLFSVKYEALHVYLNSLGGVVFNIKMIKIEKRTTVIQVN